MNEDLNSIRRNVPSNSQTSQQFVFQALALSHRTETAVHDTLSVKLHGSLDKVESFLNEGGEFTNTATFLAQDVFRTRRTDNDFCTGRSDTDFQARVAIDSQFTLEEFIEFSIENTISDKLKHLK